MKRAKLNSSGPFVVIDGHSQMFRACLANAPEMTSPTGEPTRGTYIFLRTLLKLVSRLKPSFLVMAVDGPIDRSRRRRIYPDYKANRKRNEDDSELWSDVYRQIGRILQMVETLGVPILRHDGEEADDVIATLVARYRGSNPAVIVSRDKDLMALVDDAAPVRVFDPLEDETFDERAVRKRYGVPAASLPIYLALAGDSSDNVPGVRGIGKVGAKKLIEQSRCGGSFNELLLALDQGRVDAKLAAKVAGDSSGLMTSYRLVRLEDDLDLGLASRADLRYKGLRMDAARSIFEELGFRRFAGREK